MPLLTLAASNAAHVPATVTQSPEPEILYEHCIRPSTSGGSRAVRRRGASEQRVQQPAQFSSDACLCSKTSTGVDKSTQTTAAVETPQSTAPVDTVAPHGEVSGQSNEEVHTDLSDFSPMQSHPSSVEGITTRSESRESLNTWPVVANEASSDQTAVRVTSVKKQRRLSSRKRMELMSGVSRRRSGSAAAAAAVSDSDGAQPRLLQLASDAAPHQMPALDWTSNLGQRSAQPQRVSFKRMMANFILFGTVALTFSTLMQWLFIVRFCENREGFEIRGFSHRFDHHHGPLY